ncbi:hypothetical protein J6590_081297 [Homalodisca vitripennis]|nr:hypothetical protein J6590_081297 [Homalodisca vitripennis]
MQLGNCHFFQNSIAISFHLSSFGAGITSFKRQEEECKKKWNGIRDSLRRARQKRKTKSGQAGTSTNKYKFESILEFLIPHLGERKGLSNIPDEEDISDETQLNDSHQQNSTKESQDVNDIEPQESVESVSLLTPTTPASRVSIDHRPLSAKRKRKLEAKPQETASSQLMAYILAEKKKESSENHGQHPVDTFLSGIATNLKSLHPVRFHSAKGKIFNIVQEYELQELLENSNQQTNMVPPNNMSSDSTSLTTSTLSEGDVSYADFSKGIQPASTSPAYNEETYTTFFKL